MPECRQAWIAGLCSIQTDFGLALSQPKPPRSAIAVKVTLADVPPELFRYMTALCCPYEGSEVCPGLSLGSGFID